MNNYNQLKSFPIIERGENKYLQLANPIVHKVQLHLVEADGTDEVWESYIGMIENASRYNASRSIIMTKLQDGTSRFNCLWPKPDWSDVWLRLPDDDEVFKKQPDGTYKSNLGRKVYTTDAVEEFGIIDKYDLDNDCEFDYLDSEGERHHITIKIG